MVVLVPHHTKGGLISPLPGFFIACLPFCCLFVSFQPEKPVDFLQGAVSETSMPDCPRKHLIGIPFRFQLQFAAPLKHKQCCVLSFSCRLKPVITDSVDLGAFCIEELDERSVGSCMDACVYIYIYVCVYLYIYIYTRIYTHIQ